MTGKERVMHKGSLLMIHHAWTWASGNAKDLRKQADDLDKITEPSIVIYEKYSNTMTSILIFFVFLFILE